MGKLWNTYFSNPDDFNVVLQDYRFVIHTNKSYFGATKIQGFFRVFLAILYSPLLALGNQPFSNLHLNAQSL